MSIDTVELGDKIIKAIKTVYDPEIPVDVYELGLICTPELVGHHVLG